MKPLDNAIAHVGGVGKLAVLIGVGQSVISNWRARNSVIDPLLCAKIESVTDGKVSRQMLRPDDWKTIWPELAVASLHKEQPAAATSKAKAASAREKELT